MKKITGVALCFLLFAGTMSAQEYLPFKLVRQYTQAQKANRFDSLQPWLTNRLGVELHYLYPLYQGIGWEEKFKSRLGAARYYKNMGQLLAAAGDYAMAAEFTNRSYTHLSDTTVKSISKEVGKLDAIQYAPAKEAILGNAGYYQALLFNEDAAHPQHRAFVYSLLEDLYKSGYRYLAMDILNNLGNRCTDSLNVFTGFMTSEPVAGELVRKALELGYQLIPFADTLPAQHTVSEADSIGASNLAAIWKRDPEAKAIIMAVNSNISEERLGDYRPLGWWIRKLSRIDPFTIEQVKLSPGSDFEYGRLYYEFLTEKFSISTPSVIFRNKRPFNPLAEKGYDLIVVHPPVSYTNNRPSWTSLDGERQSVLIQPTERNLFYVQAYYAREYNEDMLPLLVPADQTYVAAPNGYYALNLRKGKYRIVLRDAGYKILAVKDREVY